MEIKISKYKYIFNGKEYFALSNKITKEEAINRMKKFFKFAFETYYTEEKYIRNDKRAKEIRDDVLNGEFEIKKCLPPPTFPKFSNEKKFKMKWGKAFIHNPKIKDIIWNCFKQKWYYDIENYGHRYGISEDDLKLL